MELSEVKLLSAAGLTLIGCAGGLLALWAGQRPAVKSWMSVLNAGGGGVFLAAAFLVMLPRADTSWAAAGHTGTGAYMLALGGLLAMLLIDRVLLPVREHHIAPRNGEENSGEKFSALAVGIAMCVHTLLAGAALGAQATLKGALAIFAAIAGHKGSAAFVLMVMMQRAGHRQKTALMTLAIFSLSAAVGVLLGMWLTSDAAAQSKSYEAIFSALTAGMFIYVATVHVIGREFAEEGSRVARFIALMLGVALMAVLAGAM